MGAARFWSVGKVGIFALVAFWAGRPVGCRRLEQAVAQGPAAERGFALGRAGDANGGPARAQRLNIRSADTTKGITVATRRPHRTMMCTWLYLC